MDQDNRKTKEATRWVNEYADQLYAYALQRVRNKATALDLVQDSFVAAWKNFDNYRELASVKTWLFTILKNKIIDYYRSSVHNLAGPKNEDWPYFDEAAHWTIESAPASWPPESVKKMEEKEFFKILDRCKSKLQQLQQTVFAMKYLDDMKSDEICRHLNISSSNYWVLMHRAKVQLRACLEVNWFTR